MLKTKLRKYLLIAIILIAVVVAITLVTKNAFKADEPMVMPLSVSLSLTFIDSESRVVLPDVTFSASVGSLISDDTTLVTAISDQLGKLQISLRQDQTNITISKDGYISHSGSASWYNPLLTDGVIVLTKGEGTKNIFLQTIGKNWNLVAFPTIAKDTEPSDLLRYWKEDSGQYTLTNLPLVPSQISSGWPGYLLRISGESLNTSWIGWHPDQQPFRLQPFESYFVYSRQPVLFVFDADGTTPTQQFILNKDVRNIFGVPGMEPIPLDGVEFTGEGSDLSYLEAITNSWISDKVSYFDPAKQTYVNITSKTSRLIRNLYPGFGYVWYVNSANPLVVGIDSILLQPSESELKDGKGSILGKITDELGNPKVNLTVLVGTFSANTDENGEYVINNINPGFIPIKFFDQGENNYEQTSGGSMDYSVGVTAREVSIYNYVLKKVQ